MINQEKEIFKLIKSKQAAILENLVKSSDLEAIKKTIQEFLDNNLTGESLLALKYKKFRSPGGKNYVFLTNDSGYPVEGRGGERWIQSYFDFFERFIAEKVLVRRIENDNFWIESRVQNNEQHLFIGDRKNKNGEKAHLILGETGEIRIDKKDMHPSEITKKIELILTKKDGSIIKTTMEFLNEETA